MLHRPPISENSVVLKRSMVSSSFHVLTNWNSFMYTTRLAGYCGTANAAEMKVNAVLKIECDFYWISKHYHISGQRGGNWEECVPCDL